MIATCYSLIVKFPKLDVNKLWSPSTPMQSKKCLDQVSLSDRVLCLHTAWNILYAGLASGSVASYDFKVSKRINTYKQ